MHYKADRLNRHLLLSVREKLFYNVVVNYKNIAAIGQRKILLLMSRNKPSIKIRITNKNYEKILHRRIRYQGLLINELAFSEKVWLEALLIKYVN